MEMAEGGHRVLVAGASGTLGRALVSVLAHRGREVVALVRPRSASRVEPLAGDLVDLVAGEVTAPELPPSAFEGVDAIISTIGITKQRDGLTYDQVDYEGNLNLLRAAEAHGVRRFIYVSVVGADSDVAVPLLRAKRRFEIRLAESSLEWQIIRPSGFFSDIREVGEMARKGAVHLVGDGESRISPIHPADLAEVIADRLDGEPGLTLPVGGPSDYSWNELAQLCYRVIGTPGAIRHWPKWILAATLAVTRVFSRSTYGAMSFFGHILTTDTTAPHHGTRTLEEYFRAEQAASQDKGL
ncbi:MAG: SDR family oxidoreductase [bacterium]|nr:SDR family oxidoreductase [bacterium]